MADYPTKQFMGSAQTVISTATDIAAGAFSGAPSANFVNNDATYPNAPLALAMAEFPDWAAAPVAGTVVELWGLLHNVDGTDDDTQECSMLYFDERNVSRKYEVSLEGSELKWWRNAPGFSTNRRTSSLTDTK